MLLRKSCSDAGVERLKKRLWMPGCPARAEGAKKLSRTGRAFPRLKRGAPEAASGSEAFLLHMKPLQQPVKRRFPGENTTRARRFRDEAEGEMLRSYFGGAGVKTSRRLGSGFGLGFGAFFGSFLPLSLLPMDASVPQKGGLGEVPERFSSLRSVSSTAEGGFFLRKKPLSDNGFPLQNWRTALTAKLRAMAEKRLSRNHDRGRAGAETVSPPGYFFVPGSRSLSLAIRPGLAAGVPAGGLAIGVTGAGEVCAP